MAKTDIPDGTPCEICRRRKGDVTKKLKKPIIFEVHHVSYDPEDPVVLCRLCHRLWHGAIIANKCSHPFKYEQSDEEWKKVGWINKFHMYVYRIIRAKTRSEV